MPYQYHFGIDPGHKGAIVFLETGNPVPIIYDMPIKFITRKRTTRYKGEDGVWRRTKKTMTDPILDITKAAAIFRPFTGKSIHGTIERMALWGQNEKAGTNSSDTLLKEYGELKGMLDILEIPYAEVQSTSWQSYLDKPQTKDGSVRLAKYFFPEGVFNGPQGGLMDGRADAALIARFDQEKHGS